MGHIRTCGGLGGALRRGLRRGGGCGGRRQRRRRGRRRARWRRGRRCDVAIFVVLSFVCLEDQCEDSCGALPSVRSRCLRPLLRLVRSASRTAPRGVPLSLETLPESVTNAALAEALTFAANRVPTAFQQTVHITKVRRHGLVLTMIAVATGGEPIPAPVMNTR
jgi:hypothetical protein